MAVSALAGAIKCGEEAAQRPLGMRTDGEGRDRHQRALTVITFLSFVSIQRVCLKWELAQVLCWRWRPQSGRWCGVGELGESIAPQTNHPEVDSHLPWRSEAKLHAFMHTPIGRRAIMDKAVTAI